MTRLVRAESSAISISSMPPHLTPWVLRALRPLDAAPCTRFTLNHTKVTGRLQCLTHWPIEGEPRTDPEDRQKFADELAREVFDNAMQHAAAFPGLPQNFELVAHYGSDFVPQARMVLRVLGAPATGDYDEGALEPSEPPNSRGQVAQLMRHIEARERLFMTGNGTVLAHDQRIISQQGARISELEARERENFEIYRELCDRKFEREVEQRRIELEEKRLEMERQKGDKILSVVSMLMPVIANRLAGQRVFAEKVSGTDAALRTLFESITPQQLEAIASAFELPQQLVIFDLMRRFMPPEPAAPQADATGAGQGEGTRP